jgi:hypothetical protein
LPKFHSPRKVCSKSPPKKRSGCENGDVTNFILKDLLLEVLGSDLKDEIVNITFKLLNKLLEGATNESGIAHHNNAKVRQLGDHQKPVVPHLPRGM